MEASPIRSASYAIPDFSADHPGGLTRVAPGREEAPSHERRRLFGRENRESERGDERPRTGRTRAHHQSARPVPTKYSRKGANPLKPTAAYVVVYAPAVWMSIRSPAVSSSGRW